MYFVISERRIFVFVLQKQTIFCELLLSPSVRRAWIEILLLVSNSPKNWSSPSVRRAWIEIFIFRNINGSGKSPSVRRAWIEIRSIAPETSRAESPSVRRAWIEITKKENKTIDISVALRTEGVDRNIIKKHPKRLPRWSPSVRRAWIEIIASRSTKNPKTGRPPYGGRG